MGWGGARVRGRPHLILQLLSAHDSVFGKQSGWGGVTAISGCFRGVGGAGRKRQEDMVRGGWPSAGRGLGDWVELLVTEVPQIPAQPLLVPRAPFTHLWAPAHAQRGQGSEGVGGLVGTLGNRTEHYACPCLQLVLSPHCIPDCVPPLLRTLHGSQLSLGKSQGPRCGPPRAWMVCLFPL